MQLLRLIHAYMGLVIGVVLAVYAATGGALVFKDQIWQLQYPELRTAVSPASPTAHATAFRQILADFPSSVTAIKVPRGEIGAYHVYTTEGEALIRPNDHTLIDQWRWNETVTGVLSEIHFHLLAENTGKKIGGIIALVSAGLALVGLILWWPTRRSFRPRRLIARSFLRGELLRMHRDVGILSVVSVVLFSVTAAGVIFYPQARSILSNLFNEKAADILTVSAVTDKPEFGAPTDEQVAMAMAALPEANLIAYYPPSSNRSLHYFRFRHADEPHPNGRSAVYIRPGEKVAAQIIDARRAPTGERIAQFLYPLHAAMLGGGAYTAFAFVSAIAICIVALSGPLAFLRRRSRRKPN